LTKGSSLIKTVIVAFIFILLLISISSALEYDAKNVKMKQVTTVGENFDPEWSPDGSTIVYASTERGPNSCIWLVDADGGNRRMINQPESYYEYSKPTWSPDGSRIAFISSGFGGGYICVMNSDGGNVTKITPFISETNFNLTWNPDGSKITYDSRSQTTGQYCIWVMDSDGTNRIKLTTIDDAYNSIWSPDGSKIAYELSRVKQKEIWIMDPDGSNKMRLMPKKESPFEVFSDYSQPTWNPDGSKIAFVTTRFSEMNRYFDIVVLNLEDTSVTTLTDTRPRYHEPGRVVTEENQKKYEQGDEFNPKWSPDGSKILFGTGSHSGERIFLSETDLWVMNSDGSDKILLVAGSNLNPKWSPDGSKILFEQRKYRGSGDIFVLTLGEDIIFVPTPSPVTTVTPEPTAIPKPAPTPTTTPTPGTTPTATQTPMPTATPAITPTATPTPTPEEPGFELISALVGLLAVAYVVLKKDKKQR
jgi:Tol biopolymer transport system component